MRPLPPLGFQDRVAFVLYPALLVITFRYFRKNIKTWMWVVYVYGMVMWIVLLIVLIVQLLNRNAP